MVVMHSWKPPTVEMSAQAAWRRHRRDPGFGVLVAIVERELGSYRWRSLTAQMVARRVVATIDRQRVAELLQNVPGARHGENEPLRPGDRTDPRVSTLIRFLGAHHWRRHTAAALAELLLVVLLTEADQDHSVAGLD